MKTIASFQINHDTLQKGLYVSRIDGDCVTYDLRMVIPNCGTYLENAGIHTFEHLFATYVRNSPYSDRVIYFGPMGCRTGFYFIVRDSVSRTECIDLVRETLRFIADYSGDIPGASASRECGNYLEHSLPLAKAYAADMIPVLSGWSEPDLTYPD